MTTNGSERALEQGTMYQRLSATGRLVSATLRGLRDTGGGSEGDPEVEFEFEFELDGTRRSLRHRQVVSRMTMGDLRLGAALPVRIDPENPTVLVIA